MASGVMFGLISEMARKYSIARILLGENRAGAAEDLARKAGKLLARAEFLGGAGCTARDERVARSAFSAPNDRWVILQALSRDNAPWAKFWAG